MNNLTSFLTVFLYLPPAVRTLFEVVLDGGILPQL